MSGPRYGPHAPQPMTTYIGYRCSVCDRRVHQHMTKPSGGQVGAPRHSVWQWRHDPTAVAV